jgi:hypothetical protein
VDLATSELWCNFFKADVTALLLLCWLQAAGESYGKQRQWGSIGFGLASLPSGWLIGQAGLTSCFLVYGLASLPLIAITSAMQYSYKSAAAAAVDVTAAAGGSVQQDSSRRQHQHRHKQEPAELAPTSAAAAAAAMVPAGPTSQQQQQQVSGLLSQPAVLLFLWRCLFLGMGMGVMSNYEFLWLKQLGAPETLMGFAIAVSRAEQSSKQ